MLALSAGGPLALDGIAPQFGTEGNKDRRLEQSNGLRRHKLFSNEHKQAQVSTSEHK